MDWKAQITSSIEASVHAAVEASMEAAVERVLQPAIEDMRAYTDASKKRLLRQIREIGQALTPAATTVNTSVKPQATVVLGNDLDMAAYHGVALAATTPATCSTQYPSRAVTVLVPAVAPADISSIRPTRDSVFEESVDERTRRLRHRIQLAEDRARRDPVWAEKMARRHAAFRVTIPSTAAPAMATSTSPASTATLTACVVSDGDLDLASPTPCSSLCPGGDTSALPASMMASMVPGEAVVTIACTAQDSCVYPVAQPVGMPTPVHVVVADSAPTRAASSADITLGPRAPTLETTKPASSAELGSNLIMAPPMTISAVSPDPVPDAPAAVLTHAMLDIVESRGSHVLVSMSAMLDKSDCADTAVTHEDEHLLACSSVERPLAFISARDVAGDRSFVASTSAIPLTLAALSVDDGRIANKYEVLPPLKLLELSLSAKKELYVTLMLPQFTEAMVARGTSLNQLHAEGSDSSGSYGHHQKPGYAKIQKDDNILWGIQKLRPPWPPPPLEPEVMYYHTTEAAGDWTSSLGIVGRMLVHPIVNAILHTFLWLRIAWKHVEMQSKFPYAPLLSDCHFARMHFMLSRRAQTNDESTCGTSLNFVSNHGYPALTLAYTSSWRLIISGCLLQFRSEADILLWLISGHSVHVLCAVQGYTSSIAFLAILNGVAEVQHHYTCTRVVTEAGQKGWISHHVLRGNTYYSELIGGFQHEKLWDPGGFHSCAWNCQWQMVLVICKGRLRTVHSREQWTPLEGTYEVQCLRKPRERANCYHVSFTLSSTSFCANSYLQAMAEMRSVFSEVRPVENHVKCLPYVKPTLTMELFSTQPRTDGNQCRYGWRAHFVLFENLVGAMSSQGDLAGKLRVHHKLMANIVSTAAMLSRVQAVRLLNKQSSSKQAIVWRNNTAWFDDSATATILLELLRSSDQGRNLTPTFSCVHYINHTYYFDQVHAGQDLYLDAYLDQDLFGYDYYISLIQFHSDHNYVIGHGYHDDHTTIEEDQVPWDPGGFTWHRLGVKPKIKEGGMLATSLLSPGLDHGLLGLGCTDGAEDGNYKYKAKGYGEGGLDERKASAWTGLAWRCSIFLLCFPLFSPSGSIDFHGCSLITE